jgi:hypothetical protein
MPTACLWMVEWEVGYERRSKVTLTIKSVLVYILKEQIHD